MILAALLIKKYPIDKTAFERVMKALESRNKGEEIDVKEFEDIFE